MAILTHPEFHFNRLMVTVIFGIRVSEPPNGLDERLKRPGLIGLSFDQYLRKTSYFQGYVCTIAGRLGASAKLQYRSYSVLFF